jgi:transcriptional regulator with XRE-family HTH domain
MSDTILPGRDRRQQQNTDNVNNGPGRVLASAAVAGARPIFHAEFGRYLAKLREDKTGWTQSDAARFGRRHSPALSRNVIVHLEQGKTKDPEPEVLRALANLYGVEYLEIVTRFIESRYRIDLTRHTGSGRSAAQTGGIDVPSPTRVLTDERLHALDGIVSAATAIIELGEQIHAAGQTIIGRQDATTRGRAAARAQDARKRRRSAAR